MVEKNITEEEAEKREKALLDRDTRNILLGGLMSITSSITTLYILNKYIIPKTAAAVSQYIKQPSQQMSTYSVSANKIINTWKPLSIKQLKYIHKVVK